MKIRFSKKYQPLFELLYVDREIDDMKDIERLNKKGSERLEYLHKLKKIDTILVSGGRDSGKTFGIGCLVVAATDEFGHRVLYTRQTMSSTDNSITAALENRMEIIGVESDYTFANNNYNCKHNNGKITITGQKTSVGTQTAKLKSLEDYSIFLTDEGEELTDLNDWKKIKRSMRAQDVQCLSIIVFNPPSKKHWIYEEFYTHIPEGFNGIVGNIMYIHTTYLDNGKENMAEQNWNDYERLREQYEKYESLTRDEKEKLSRTTRLFKDWREYKTVVLGGFKEAVDGVIFDYEVGEFVESEFEQIYGADQGFTHPSAVVKVNVVQKLRKIYVKEVYYDTQRTETFIYEAIKDEVGFSRIWVDDAAAMFIAGLKEKGLNVKGARKPKINDSINAILDYEIIVDPSSINLMKEFDEYHQKNGAVVDKQNHAVDAFRYAFNRIVNTRIAEPGSH